MPRRKLSPRRQAYEADFPTVTGRVPAAVKERLLAALRAEDLNFSEWVQARVAGSGAQTTAAYRRGRAEGEEVAGIAGFRAGLLTSVFAAEHSRSYNAATLAQRLAEHPDQRVIADRLIPADYQADWARLRRAVTPKRSGVSTP